MRELSTLDLDSHMTANGLYDAINESRHRLSIAGTEIRNDRTPISDLGVCAQCVIDVTEETPDFVYLWKMFKDLENPFVISWWQQVIDCIQDPHECHEIDYSMWAHVECDQAGNIKQLVMTDMGLKGRIHLDVPRRLRVLYLGNNRISNANFSGLTGSKLAVLHLGNNKISSVHLGDLHGTHLGLLYLSRNQITNINLNDLAGSNIRVLGLAVNRIASIDLSALLNTKLKYLYLGHNKMLHVRFGGLTGSDLSEIDLDNNWMSTVDLKNLEDSNVKWLSLRNNPLTNIEDIKKYKMKHPKIRITL